MEVLQISIPLEPKYAADVASTLRTQLTANRWKALAEMAAAIVALQERETGSLVLVVPADRQVAEVARALGAPGLERTVERLKGG